MTLFTESYDCSCGVHCARCRSDRNWRDDLRQRFDLPDDSTDFPCPKGLALILPATARPKPPAAPRRTPLPVVTLDTIAARRAACLNCDPYGGNVTEHDAHCGHECATCKTTIKRKVGVVRFDGPMRCPLKVGGWPQ